LRATFVRGATCRFGGGGGGGTGGKSSVTSPLGGSASWSCSDGWSFGSQSDLS